MVAGSAFEAAVPGCPEWDVEGLIRHLGDVHRWAATIVRDHVKERLRRDFAGPAGREPLLAWFAEGHAQLVEVLPKEEFEEQHLPGAIHIPLRKIDAGVRAGLVSGRPVVVYCWDSA